MKRYFKDSRGGAPEIVARIKELGFPIVDAGAVDRVKSNRTPADDRNPEALLAAAWKDERPVVVVAAAIGETIGGEIIAIAIVIATTTEIAR